MFNRSEWWKKRYANDSKFREKKAASSRAYNQKHQPEIQERRRQRMQSDPEYRERTKTTQRRSKLKQTCAKFGMTLADFDRMLEGQNGVCALCKKKPKQRLCIDHCHATGKVRRLLCYNCNCMLGNARDNPDVLYAGGDYIIEFRDPPMPTPQALAFWAVPPPRRLRK
jgi:recombination endonuclease VII